MPRTPPRSDHHSLPPQPQAPPSTRWWKRKIWKFPAWVWIIGAIIVIAGLFLDEPETPETPTATAIVETPAPQSDEPTTEGLAIPTSPESEISQDSAPIPETPAIDGCTPATQEMTGSVAAGLDNGLTLSLAYTTADELGRIAYGASIYRASDGSRVSSSDTWIIDGGQIYALSGSANEYSSFPDGRDLPDNPSAGFEPYSRA